MIARFFGKDQGGESFPVGPERRGKKPEGGLTNRGLPDGPRKEWKILARARALGVDCVPIQGGMYGTESWRDIDKGDDAGVVKLVDALDSKSSDPRGHGGSTPPSGTN